MDKSRTGLKADKIIFALALAAASLIACAASYITGEEKKEELRRALSDNALRVHIIAQSDSAKDKELKLKVKDRVLEYFEEELPLGLDAAGTKKWARSHTKDLEAMSEETLKEEGARLSVRAAVKICYFPEMLCGGILFPQGDYDALCIEIGSARGQNWWCVLYPWLCPDKSGRLVVPGGEGRTSGAGFFHSRKNLKIKWYYKMRREK